MAINLPSNSRFRVTDIINKYGEETFGLWKKNNFLTREYLDEDLITFVVDGRFVGRPDLISEEVYSTPELYWVVIGYMKPLNPVNWPEIGTVLRLPPRSVVLSET